LSATAPTRQNDKKGCHRTTFLPYGRGTPSIRSITMGAAAWLASRKGQGASIFFPVGVLSACRPTGPSEMTVCALQPEFAKEVEEELDLSSVDGLRGFSTTEDETLRSLVKRR
jgi:hypothetical protein